jgi:multidrug efflux system membrane fusion protein
MKIRRSYLFAALLAVAATAWIASGNFGESATEPKVKKAPAELVREIQTQQVRVATLTASEHQIQLSVNGQTEAVRQVDIKAEITGPIAELPIEKGTRVTTGTVLARIAELERPAILAEAKALLAQRKLELEAANKLAEQGYRAQTQRAASEAVYEAALAAVRRAEVRIDHLDITAPFDGILDQRMVEIGDHLEIGDPIVGLVDLDPLLIVAHVSERDVGKLKTGTAGRARLASGQKVTGHIRFIAAAADSQTRTFRVELEVPNPQLALADGITAELHLPLRRVMAHFISPSILTLADAGAIGVQTVDSDDTVVFRPVTIVEQRPDGIWVTGLPETVRVITVGHEFVRDGQTVVPVDEDLVLQQQSGTRDAL